QAEDGIRDYKVTGVQTCALPICLCGQPRSAPKSLCLYSSSSGGLRSIIHPPISRYKVVSQRAFATVLTKTKRPSSPSQRGRASRSEERRVGKECRAGSTTDSLRN